MDVEMVGERESALQQVLSNVGLAVRANWLQQVSFVLQFERVIWSRIEERSFWHWQVLQRSDAENRSTRDMESFVFEQALYSDLRVAGDGTLPPGVASLHKHIVRGKHFLQVWWNAYAQWFCLR